MFMQSLSDERKPLRDEELLGQRLREVAAVAKELAEEATDQLGNRTAVIDVAGRQREGQEFTTVVDHQMQLEAVEPAD